MLFLGLSRYLRIYYIISNGKKTRGFDELGENLTLYFSYAIFCIQYKVFDK
jgi:hypothetical protein